MALAISGFKTLHRLIYVSRQILPPGSDLDAEVRRIVEVSVSRNAGDEITGLLLEHEGWFVQALEGQAEKVMTTYRRILNDRRHEDSRVIVSGPVDQREFGAWAMCARQIGPADRAILTTLKQRGSFDPRQLTISSALRLLTAVREIKGTAPA